MWRTTCFSLAIVATSVACTNAVSASDKQEPAPGSEAAPVSIIAVGGQLIITSTDPQALELVQSLSRLLTQGPGTDSGIVILKLKYADATETAQVLNELFDDPRPSAGPQQRGSLNSDPGAGQRRGTGPNPALGQRGTSGASSLSQPATSREPRVRIVADTINNALLVRASPLQVLEIQRLLNTAIDLNLTDSQAVIRTWILPPLKYANAPEVAQVLRDVFQKQMGGAPSKSGAARNFTAFGEMDSFSFAGAGAGPGSTATPATGNRPITLSIGVDERSNCLILGCTERMKDNVQQLVDQLEYAARSTPRTVRIVPISGIDPYLVQQAIEAIQGRTMSRPNAGNGMPGMGSIPGVGGVMPPGLGPQFAQ